MSTESSVKLSPFPCTETHQVFSEITDCLRSRIRPVSLEEVREYLLEASLDAPIELIVETLEALAEVQPFRRVEGGLWIHDHSYSALHLKRDWVWPPYVPGYSCLAVAVEPTGWRLLWIEKDGHVCSHLDLKYAKQVPSLPAIEWPFVDGYLAKEDDFWNLGVSAVFDSNFVDSDPDALPEAATITGLPQAH